MQVRTIQYLLASVFFVLGGWCLVSPSSVIALCISPAYRTDAPLAAFAVGCFGAQAIIAGLFAAFSRFTRATFLAYGIALLPFFVFDWWFTAVVPMFTAVGLLDAVGNVVMLMLCVLGWRAAKAEAVGRLAAPPNP
jgi:hypothetical protein